MNSAWEDYRRFWQRDRFIGLSAEELRPACPHLNDLYFELATSYPIMTLALPPIKVRGSVRVATLHNTEEGYQLQWISNSTKLKNFTFAAEAAEYAEQVWPEKLIDDNWIDVQNILLCDPTYPDIVGRPNLVTILYVTLSRSWQEVAGDMRFPIYRSWNNAIQHITCDLIEGEEYGCGRHKVYNFRNCSFCGGGLDSTACSGCSFTYERISNGWRVPLAPQLVEFLQTRRGHHFAFHPSQLWTNES